MLYGIISLSLRRALVLHIIGEQEKYIGVIVSAGFYNLLSGNKN